MPKLEFLIAEFQRLHGVMPARIARAPGRVNLIGEQSDYNDEFVMPIAIDRQVMMAARRRADKCVRVTALDVLGEQHDEFALDSIGHHHDYGWANYVRGVAFYLEQTIHLQSLDAVMTSTLPSGAGLSSVVLLSRPLHKNFRALRDVSPNDFARAGNYLPENLRQRARHVITKNERVKQAARAVERNDAQTFGALMNDSQTSLRNDYKASAPELDLMVELARRQPGCYGSHLTNAGWGGATVNLVQTMQVNSFITNVARGYVAETGIEPWVAPVRASTGAGWIEPFQGAAPQ